MRRAGIPVITAEFDNAPSRGGRGRCCILFAVKNTTQFRARSVQQSVFMTARVACAFFMDRIDRVAAASRAVRLVFDVAVRSEQVLVCGGGGFRLLRLERPAEFGCVDVLAVDTANSQPRCFDGLGQVGDCDPRDQSDDGYHYHDFNEREPGRSVCFHNTILVCMIFGWPQRERVTRHQRQP